MIRPALAEIIFRGRYAEVRPGMAAYQWLVKSWASRSDHELHKSPRFSEVRAPNVHQAAEMAIAESWPGTV